MTEPWEYEEIRQTALEKERLRWLKGSPWCNVCDEQIADAKCYVMDADNKMESCICKNCMEDQLNKIRKSKISVYLLEWLEEEIEYRDCFQATPHE